MKAMILAAGQGERLLPLTKHTPKPLLKAGQYRLIEYTIQSLVQAGFTEIIINYAHLGNQFPAVLGNGDKYGAKISYSPEPEGGLETAGGIIKALPLLADQPFLVVNGDIWTDYPFETLSYTTLDSDMLCHLVLVTNPDHHPEGDFPLDSGLIMQSGDTKYTFSGIGIYNPSLFADLDVQRLRLKPLLLKAIEQEQAGGELYRGEWSDIGTVERLRELNDKLSSF